MPEIVENRPEAARDTGTGRGALLTTDQAAKLLMKSGERIRQLAKEGWIERQGPPGNARYYLLDVVQGYIRFRDDEDRRQTKSAAASRVSDARAREIELRNAQREARMIETDEALAAIDALVGLFLTLLSGLAARCTRDLQVRRVIEGAVFDIRNQLADLAASLVADIAARRAAGAAVADHASGPIGGSE